MKKAHSEILMSQTAVDIRRIAECINLLFGRSLESGILESRCTEALDVLKSFADGRGMNSTTVAVMGAKNSGKSWLCRLLIKDETERELIPSGHTSKFATEKATWIGPDAPPALDNEHELSIRIRPDAMIDLGVNYTLLDLPGYNDASIPAREAALKAIRGVSLRIIVISSATLSDKSQKQRDLYFTSCS
jgi:hypothetical protein